MSFWASICSFTVTSPVRHGAPELCGLVLSAVQISKTKMVLTNGSTDLRSCSNIIFCGTEIMVIRSSGHPAFLFFSQVLLQAFAGAVCLQGAAGLSSICRSEWPRFRSCLVVFSSFFIFNLFTESDPCFRSKCFHQTEFSSSLWPKSQSAISIHFLIKGPSELNCHQFPVLSQCVLDVRT